MLKALGHHHHHELSPPLRHPPCALQIFLLLTLVSRPPTFLRLNNQPREILLSSARPSISSASAWPVLRRDLSPEPGKGEPAFLREDLSSLAKDFRANQRVSSFQPEQCTQAESLGLSVRGGRALRHWNRKIQ
jgi:hypothetical protein